MQKAATWLPFVFWQLIQDYTIQVMCEKFACFFFNVLLVLLTFAQPHNIPVCVASTCCHSYY